MTYSNGIRPLSAEEINFVAGGYSRGKQQAGNVNIIDIHQTNIGGAVALGFGGAFALNAQGNAAVVVNESPINVDIR